MRKQRGITLIALVITIIILLILAGITIAMLTGENGILNMANRARKNYEEAQEKELDDLDKLYSSILIATNDSSQVTINVEDLKTLINKTVEEKLSEINKNEVYYATVLTTSTGTNQKTVYATLDVPYDCLLYASYGFDLGEYVKAGVINYDGICLNSMDVISRNQSSSPRTVSGGAVFEAKEGDKIDFWTGLFDKDGVYAKSMNISFWSGLPYVRILRKL